MTGDVNSCAYCIGEVIGDAVLSPLGTRALMVRKGVSGGGKLGRTGDSCRLLLCRLGSAKLVRLRPRELVTLLRLRSPGDSARRAFASEEMKLESLSIAASSLMMTEPRFTFKFEVLKEPKPDRGVREPTGLLDPEDAAVEEPARPRCLPKDESDALRRAMARELGFPAEVMRRIGGMSMAFACTVLSSVTMD